MNFQFLTFSENRWKCSILDLEHASYAELSNELVIVQKSVMVAIKAAVINEHNKPLENYWLDLSLTLTIFRELLKTELNKRVDYVPFGMVARMLPIKENNITVTP